MKGEAGASGSRAVAWEDGVYFWILWGWGRQAKSGQNRGQGASDQQGSLRVGHFMKAKPNGLGHPQRERPAGSWGLAEQSGTW